MLTLDSHYLIFMMFFIVILKRCLVNFTVDWHQFLFGQLFVWFVGPVSGSSTKATIYMLGLYMHICDRNVLLFFVHKGVFDYTDDTLDMTICPQHRDAYGIRWRLRRRLCCCPVWWRLHGEKNKRGEKGITLVQSRQLYILTNHLVPIGSRKYIISYGMVVKLDMMQKLNNIGI